MRRCPACDQPIPSEVDPCPHCGIRLNPECDLLSGGTGGGGGPAVMVIVVILAILGLLAIGWVVIRV